jgi:8-amino-3,8-dideoxy-alpha-D-manno-octulosonate transaminase
MNAAVGVAQLARLDEFLNIQKRNYTILREALSDIPEVVFRTVPEGGEENYSFLNFFMPSEELAQIAHQELIEAGVDGCFYWFDNNWHYYKKWEHLTELKSLGKLPKDVVESLPDYSKADFSESDQWMSRNISCLIKLGWTEAEVKARAKQVAEAIRAVL